LPHPGREILRLLVGRSRKKRRIKRSSNHDALIVSLKLKLHRLDPSGGSTLFSARVARPISSNMRKELTLRCIIIGVIITLVFTAANIYAGLKAALTFSTSIPAAVISMAILRNFRDATIQENNIVQTVASAAGTLSSIIFVLPGLIMIGYWTDFPFWTSFWI